MKELEYPFDSDYLLTNKRALKKQIKSSHSEFEKKRVAILGGSTIAALKDMLELFLLNYAIEPEFYLSDYNSYYEDAIFSNAELDAFRPDVIYIYTTIRNITIFPNTKDSLEKVDKRVEEIKEKYVAMWNAISKRFSCLIIQNNFELPEYRLLGNNDAIDYRGTVYFINEINRNLSLEIAKRSDVCLCDINYISSDYGLSNWYNSSIWYSYKYAMDLPAVPFVAHSVANVIKAVYGKNKKGIILDLDNTLWGGIISEDGKSGIELGCETPIGQAYLDFQKYLKRIKDIGILLNINSKNYYAEAMEGINHPDSQLTCEDFCVVKINWETKDNNIKAIASEIGILPDSFVFVDDNPAERMIVSNNIPGISVPEMDKVTNYIRTIDRSGFFENVSLSTEDIDRSTLYSINALREKTAAEYSDYGDYLYALSMEAYIGPFETYAYSRIAQLTNKTNQFNLTTTRYTVAEIEQFANKDDVITLFGKLKDCFGDNGIVSVIIAEKQGEDCYINLWLMSCRVLKRTFEYAMFDELVRECKKRGVRKLRGCYYQTKKNEMVRTLYQDLGFSCISSSEEKSEWILDISKDYFSKNRYIEILED